jgi:hypothetical protein
MLIDKLISWPPHPLFIKHAISPPSSWAMGKGLKKIVKMPQAAERYAQIFSM